MKTMQFKTQLVLCKDKISLEHSDADDCSFDDLSDRPDDYDQIMARRRRRHRKKQAMGRQRVILTFKDGCEFVFNFSPNMWQPQVRTELTEMIEALEHGSVKHLKQCLKMVSPDKHSYTLTRAVGTWYAAFWTPSPMMWKTYPHFRFCTTSPTLPDCWSFLCT
jgi:hypothetical protein